MTDSKQAVRAALLQAHRELSEDERAISDNKIQETFLRYCNFQSFHRIFFYASTAYEINTHALIDAAYRQGKTVALPKSLSGGVMDFFEYTGTLTEGKFKIPEPTGEQILYPTENDIMIVPGLAFTPKGHRMGYGGGYYDRYLAKHPCKTVGLCRERFLADKLPIAWNDLPVDCVITDGYVYQCKNGASFEAPCH